MKREEGKVTGGCWRYFLSFGGKTPVMPMKKKSWFEYVLFAGLSAGILDIFAAIVILSKGNAVGTFRYIASGVFGDDAFTGGADMVAWGVLFHFLIALGFAAGYFVVYPYLPILRKNKWVNGIFYGLFIWATMNYLVLPLTLTPPGVFTWGPALRSMLILTLCVSIPVVWLADRYYSTRALIG